MYKEALKDNGQKGYLIIHFRELNKVVMINILDFISLKVYLDIKAKKSFNYIEFMSYGGVEIPLYIPNDKRSNYLDLSKLNEEDVKTFFYIPFNEKLIDERWQHRAIETNHKIETLTNDMFDIYDEVITPYSAIEALDFIELG